MAGAAPLPSDPRKMSPPSLQGAPLRVPKSGVANSRTGMPRTMHNRVTKRSSLSGESTSMRGDKFGLNRPTGSRTLTIRRQGRAAR